MNDSDSFFADADVMSAAEAEGSDSEEESDEEESDAAADLVPSGMSEVIPSMEVDAGRPPFGVIMVEPTVEELRRWRGLWRPVAYARRGGHGSGVKRLWLLSRGGRFKQWRWARMRVSRRVVLVRWHIALTG